MLNLIFMSLWCFCLLLECSHGFVLRTKIQKQILTRQRALDPEVAELVNKAIDGAAFFAKGAGLLGASTVGLLGFSIFQSSVGMRAMGVRMDADRAENKADKAEMRARINKDKAETDFKFFLNTSLTVVAAVIAYMKLVNEIK
jgi:hypothetical protein